MKKYILSISLITASIFPMEDGSSESSLSMDQNARYALQQARNVLYEPPPLEVDSSSAPPKLFNNKKIDDSFFASAPQRSTRDPRKRHSHLGIPDSQRAQSEPGMAVISQEELDFLRKLARKQKEKEKEKEDAEQHQHFSSQPASPTGSRIEIPPIPNFTQTTTSMQYNEMQILAAALNAYGDKKADEAQTSKFQRNISVGLNVLQGLFNALLPIAPIVLGALQATSGDGSSGCPTNSTV